MTTVIETTGNDTSSLATAKVNKQDQFFTQLNDIQAELHHYRKHLKGKTVFVNCDGSIESNFRKHFMMAFDIYELKKLIVTTFNVDGTPAKKFEIVKQPKVNASMMDSAKFTYLEGDGDFRSDECVALLKECDVVVGNPPFSLFREYVSQIMEHKKKMIIIGNANSITYKEIFPLIQDNKLWLGVTGETTKEYQVPNSVKIPDSNKLRRVDADGNQFLAMRNTRWFTNLRHSKRNEELLMYKTYSAAEYEKYENFDAVNVDKVKAIPVDYAGNIGVPITFLDKYNPNQFEIVKFRKGDDNKDLRLASRKSLYFRIIIRNKNPKV